MLRLAQPQPEAGGCDSRPGSHLGVLRRCPRIPVVDNFPAAVAGADALHPRLTRGFLEYSQHRGFITDPARVRHPKDKPHVERGIQYVRERFFKGGQFRDLAHLRDAAARWCRDVAGERIPRHHSPESLLRSSGRRSLVPCPPGTANPTNSPTGEWPKSIPITTWPASTLSTRCRLRCAPRARRWRSASAASWCASTTGASWSSCTPASPGEDAPRMSLTTHRS